MKQCPLIILFILIYTFTAAKAITGHLQDSIKIDIVISNKDSGEVELRTFSWRKTLALKSGKTSVVIKSDRVYEMLLFTDPNARDLDDSSIVRILVQHSDIKISLTLNNGVAENIRITGSEAQIDKQSWENENRSHLKAIVDLRNQYIRLGKNDYRNDSKSTKIEMDSIKPSMDRIYNKVVASVFRLVETDPDSYACGYLLFHYATRIPIDSLEKYYLKLGPEVQQATFSVAVFDRLYTLSSNFRSKYDSAKPELKNVHTVFDFTIPDINEQPFSLSKFKGKPILLFFWATWCPGCHQQAPYINKLINQFKNDSITFVSISLDLNMEAFKKSDHKIDLPCTTLIDTKNTLRYFYKFLFVPTTILLDHNGKVIDDNVNAFLLESQIENAIKEYKESKP